MSPPRRPPPWLVFIVGPLAVLPLVLAIWPMQDQWFFAVGAAICFASPAVGFWWGESRGTTEGRRTALGCLTTVALFAFYLLWALILARLIFDR